MFPPYKMGVPYSIEAETDIMSTKSSTLKFNRDTFTMEPDSS
jgi:hypothetical protein